MLNVVISHGNKISARCGDPVAYRLVLFFLVLCVTLNGE